MKKLFVCLAVLGLFVANQAFAQSEKIKGEVKIFEYQEAAPQHTPSEKATIETTKIDRIVSLNATQKQQVQAINLETAQKIDVLRTNRNQNVDAFNAGVEAAYASQRAAISQLLTPTQSQKMAAAVVKMKAERNEQVDID